MQKEWPLSTSVWSHASMNSQPSGWSSAKRNLTQFESKPSEKWKFFLTNWWILKTFGFRQTEKILWKKQFSTKPSLFGKLFSISNEPPEAVHYVQLRFFDLHGSEVVIGALLQIYQVGSRKFQYFMFFLPMEAMKSGNFQKLFRKK